MLRVRAKRLSSMVEVMEINTVPERLDRWTLFDKLRYARKRMKVLQNTFELIQNRIKIMLMDGTMNEEVVYRMR